MISNMFIVDDESHRGGRRSSVATTEGINAISPLSISSDVRTTPRSHDPERLIARRLSLSHLVRMTDDTGLLQHATYSVPDREHGYCVDDNARALQLVCHLHQDQARPEVLRLIDTYLSFLRHAWNRETGRFRNFMAYNRQWREETGSEDSHGRALWGLATAATIAPLEGQRALAAQLLQDGIGVTTMFGSPRALAYAILAFNELCSNRKLWERNRSMLQTLAETLDRKLPESCPESCDASQSSHTARDWPWPEECATYANARIPHSLIIAGHLLDRSDLTQRGLNLLVWLFDLQTSRAGHLTVIGNEGWHKMQSKKAEFDQQPIEALCLIEAASDARRISRDMIWYDRAMQAWKWFVGENDQGCCMIDSETGGCFDGLTRQGVNRNQGAESLLSWLRATWTVQKMRRSVL